MTTKTKGRNGGNRATPKTSDSQNYTGTDPLIGWFNLLKPSRKRQQKRSWKRGNQKGRIDTCLAGQLTLLAVVCVLIVCGWML